MNRAQVFIPSVLLTLLASACGAEKDTPDTTGGAASATATTSGPAPTASVPSSVTPTSSGPVGPAPSVTTGDTAGSTAGDTSGDTAGDTAGDTGGDTAGPPPAASSSSVTPPLPTEPGPMGSDDMSNGPPPDMTVVTPPDPTAEMPMGPTGMTGPLPPETVPEPVLVTSGEGAYWQEGEPAAGSGSATITVNADQAEQDWNGFGGTFNEKGWEALLQLSEADRDRAIKLLFARDGAAFTDARVPIGASDYARSRYSLAETPDDFEMANFSIERDKEMLIPYIKAALAINPNIRFWASPWTPPPWMKDNNAYDRGYMKNTPEVLGAHALYLARFVEEYAKEGIEIRAVHPQNEPGWQQDYPSCGWSNDQFADYIANYLGPLFEERGLTTEIWLGTMSNGNLDNSLARSVMGVAGATQYIKGISLQWEMEEQAASFVSMYDVPIIQSEHKCGNYPWQMDTYKADKAPNDHAYALESWGLLKSWITKGVNQYMFWNMVLNTIGNSIDEVRAWNQNALLAVDTGAKTLILTPTYHVTRHFSQFVEPGAVRVGTQGGDAVAFKNPDGTIVTVAHNSGGSAQATTVAVGGTSYSFDIPGRGWATLNIAPQ